ADVVRSAEALLAPILGVPVIRAHPSLALGEEQRELSVRWIHVEIEAVFGPREAVEQQAREVVVVGVVARAESAPVPDLGATAVGTDDEPCGRLLFVSALFDRHARGRAGHDLAYVGAAADLGTRFGGRVDQNLLHGRMIEAEETGLLRRGREEVARGDLGP